MVALSAASTVVGKSRLTVCLVKEALSPSNQVYVAEVEFNPFCRANVTAWAHGWVEGKWVRT